MNIHSRRVFSVSVWQNMMDCLIKIFIGERKKKQNAGQFSFRLSVCVYVHLDHVIHVYIKRKHGGETHQTQDVRLGSRQLHQPSHANVLTCLTCLFVLTCFVCLLSYCCLCVHDNLDFTQAREVCSAKPELYIYQQWT